MSLRSLLVVCLALAGPALVALAGDRLTGRMPPLALNLLGVIAIIVLVVGVFAFTIRSDGFTYARIGLAETTLASIPIGILIAVFFVAAFGPIAQWLLSQFGTGFEGGINKLAGIPTWALVVTIIVVASAEELLYRVHAIEVLGPALGSRSAAGMVACIAFFLAHVPMWGWGPALTTLLSGGVFTVLYLWRPDVVPLIIAHVATDLMGLVIGPRLTQ